MKCPVCTSQHLLISERQGIEIDYCPQCRGVWLDRGELDKLIERSATTTAAAVPAPAQRPAPPAQDLRFGHGGHGSGHAGYERREHHGQNHHGGYGYDAKRKKKGFLGEIFDFD